MARIFWERLLSTEPFTAKGGAPMGKFGKLPARAPESFGVAGLLGDRCKIYYDSIFSARHIGRVSDLLTAQLKSIGFDELEFRTVLMFSLYEGYRTQLQSASRPDG